MRFSFAAILIITNTAYVGTESTPAFIVKIDLTTFTEIGSIQMDDGEDFLVTSVTDFALGFSFFGCNTLPGKIVQIQLTGNTHTHIYIVHY